MSTLVSVIIPCFNAERWVAEAIQSCLSQTYEPIEVIVVDDGSTDKSLDVIKSFGDKIRWESGPNRSGCVARNRGAELANGEYFQFLDADDVLDADKIYHQMMSIDDRASVASTCRLIVTETPGEKVPLPPFNGKEWIKGDEFLVKWQSGKLSKEIFSKETQNITFGNSSSWLLPKAVYAKTGGWNENLVMCQDSEFFAKVAANCSFVEINRHAFGYYRVGNPNCVSVGMSRSKAESCLLYCIESEKILKKIAPETCKPAIVTNYVSFVCRFYPHFPDLVERAYESVKLTGEPIHVGILAPKLRIASRLIGLRAALAIRALVRK